MKNETCPECQNNPHYTTGDQYKNTTTRCTSCGGYDKPTPTLNEIIDSVDATYLKNKLHETNIKPQSVWRHKNGNLYKIIILSNFDSNQEKYPPTIVYQGENGKVWSRKLVDWHRSMKLVFKAN